MVTAVAIGLALALAYWLGAYRGREGERQRFARGQIERFEAELMRSRGRLPHRDPSSAPVVRLIRYQRIARR
jgi:hypothetical protein